MASILAINAGSSSIKFALYPAAEPLTRSLHGKVDRIGSPSATLTFTGGAPKQDKLALAAVDAKTAANLLVDWLEKQAGFDGLAAVGHRVVHGMERTDPARITAELLGELRRISQYDPDHLPRETELMEAFRDRRPDLPQVACFDTAFHSPMPRVAKMLPIPRRFEAAGVRRYGFHGLSYAFLMEELARTAGVDAAQGRVILAHLGNGASMAAVRAGKSIDTSMGFTPSAGLPMGTRAGDLDPGVAWYMMQAENLTPVQFNAIVNRESGLLGVSETSSDMRDLIERQSSDVRAAEAVELFCYQVRKWIGAYAAVLGGVETLVFAGGIGENIGEVRSRACRGLQFLGIELDAASNAGNGAVISTGTSRVAVRVIRTDEELMIAREVFRFLSKESV